MDFANSLVSEPFLGLNRASLAVLWNFSTAAHTGSFLREKSPKNNNLLYYKQSKNGAKEYLPPSDDKP